AIAFTETFPASAIPPLDETWSKVFAAAIATDQPVCGKDWALVVAVGGAHEASQRPYPESSLPHDPSHRLVIDVPAPIARLGSDAPVAVARKFRTQPRDPLLHCSARHGVAGANGSSRSTARASSVGILARWRGPGAAHDRVVRVALSASQPRPFLEQVDLHSELAPLALQFADLALVLRDPHRFGQLVGELAGLVLADPQPNQIAREAVAARQLVHARAPLEQLARDLALELRAETPMPGHGLSSD